jgi:hypothetical protein
VITEFFVGCAFFCGTVRRYVGRWLGRATSWSRKTQIMHRIRPAPKALPGLQPLSWLPLGTLIAD